MKPYIQKDDAARVRVLREYDIANTEPEEEYDQIAELAISICRTEVALVSFIDHDTQWFKSHPGTEHEANTRELALCSHAINEPQVLTYVEDTRKDLRFADNPMVTGPERVQFYAGVPLLSPEGYALGTLCVMHREPHTLEEWQKRSLKQLASQVLKLLELRRANKRILEREERLQRMNDELKSFAQALTHDIKGPLGNIYSLSELLISEYKDVLDEEGQQMAGFINSSSKKLGSLVTDVLDYYQSAHEGASVSNFSLQLSIESIISLLHGLQDFDISLPEDLPSICTNQVAFEQVLRNLLSNAVKYHDKPDKRIEIGFRDLHDCYEFSVSDNGRGISDDNLHRVFDKFDNLGVKSHNEKYSTGLGLALVAKVVDHMHGDIKVESELGKGSTFTFTFGKDHGCP